MSQNDQDTTILQLRLSKATAAQIESLAQATGQDQTEIAQDAVSAYVAFEAAQLTKIHEGIRAADAGNFATREDVEAAANRYRAYRAYRAEQAGSW